MTQHPNYKEVVYSLELFKSNGFVPVGYSDDDTLVTTNDIKTIADAVCSVDECWVSVKAPNNKEIDLFFVLGNEPGVAINDYTYLKEFDDIMTDLLNQICNHFNP